MILPALSTLLFALSALALSPAEWRSQSIYQIVTDRFALPDGGDSPSCTTDMELSIFCNGTFGGIINKLDYIQDMGFTAIWISPVVKNIDGGSPDGFTKDGSAYHGYWAQDIYSINEHFGGASGLSDLSAALHDRGMYLMVDIVVNHMAYWCGKAQEGSCGPAGTIDFSSFNPFNQSSYYHSFCEIDYNNATSILDCWEGSENVPLVDLRTEDSDIQSMFNDWIKQLIAEFNIDGLRVDSLQQSGSFFFPSFLEAAGGMYMVGEVFQQYPTKVCPYQQAGMPGVLNYPMFYYITDAFQTSTGSMSGLADGIKYTQGNCSDITLLGGFLENHDNARFPSLTGDITRAMNAITFTLLQDGIPITYYGQEQHLNGGGVPQNREALWSTGGYNTDSQLYQMIASVNAVRNQAIRKDASWTTTLLDTPYYDDHTIVARKGGDKYQIVSVYDNRGENGASSTLSLTADMTGFSQNEKVMEILTCEVYTTGKDGSLSVFLSGGQPKVFFNKSALGGSDLCKNYTTGSAAPSNSTGSCGNATVLFEVYVNTTYGESVVIAGNIPVLGDWTPSNGLALSSSNYTTSSPLWYATAEIDPGTVFQWKPIVVETDGTDNWYGGDNLRNEAPTGCNPTSAVNFTYTR